MYLIYFRYLSQYLINFGFLWSDGCIDFTIIWGLFVKGGFSINVLIFKSWGVVFDSKLYPVGTLKC